VTTSAAFPDSLVLDPCYPRLKDHLIESTGLAYYSDKDADLAGRIRRRFSKIGLHDCNSYLDFLTNGEKGQTELDELIAELTIGETYFFRYREQFEALRTTVFPEIIARNQASRRLHVWSAGCATGAEAYSVAILLNRELSQQIDGWDVSIVGTDINRAFLGRAREGKFEEWAFRSTPDEVRQACFHRAGNSWVIGPEYKRWVAFQYHNLVKHPFPSLLNNLCCFDLILCRNAMIYFSRDIIRKLIAQFHQSLVEGGWLLVGHAEPNTELFQSFRTVNVPGATLYQKTQRSAYPHVTHEGELYPSMTLEDLAAPNGIALPTPLEPPAKQMPEPVAISIPPVAPTLSDVRLLADQGEWEDAARCSRKLIDTDALNPRAHFYYALVLEQMGLHADAEQSLRRTIYLDRGFVLAHYYLGLILQTRGERRAAVRFFENVRILLRSSDAGQILADADELTAGDLISLAGTHLEVLQRR
jgi:chemotaxis protein methyltransferase CheR